MRPRRVMPCNGDEGLFVGERPEYAHKKKSAYRSAASDTNTTRLHGDFSLNKETSCRRIKLKRATAISFCDFFINSHELLFVVVIVVIAASTLLSKIMCESCINYILSYKFHQVR